MGKKLFYFFLFFFRIERGSNFFKKMDRISARNWAASAMALVTTANEDLTPEEVQRKEYIIQKAKEHMASQSLQSQSNASETTATEATGDTSKRKRIVTCGFCHQEGHSVKKCQAEGADEKRAENKRKAKARRLSKAMESRFV